MAGNGRCPLGDWLSDLPDGALAKCIAATKELEKRGDELERPISGFLQDGIYELRVKHDRIQYRILYFFLGKGRACLSHGFVKKTSKVPAEEIRRAIRHKSEWGKGAK
jgi:phage-related protein